MYMKSLLEMMKHPKCSLVDFINEAAFKPSSRYELINDKYYLYKEGDKHNVNEKLLNEIVDKFNSEYDIKEEVNKPMIEVYGDHINIRYVEKTGKRSSKTWGRYYKAGKDDKDKKFIEFLIIQGNMFPNKSDVAITYETR